MKQHEANTIIKALANAVNGLIEPAPGDVKREVVAHGLNSRLVKPEGSNGDATPGAYTAGFKDGQALPAGAFTVDQMEKLYQFFRKRMLDDLTTDPIFLKMIHERQHIEVEVTPRVVALDGSTLRGRVARLMAAGFFKTPRTVSAVRKELSRTGPDPGGGGNLGNVINEFKRDGFFVDEAGGYLFNDIVRVTEKEMTVI